MTLTELIAEIGEAKIAVQMLHEAVTNVSDRKPQRGQRVSAVTFLTTHLHAVDLLEPGGEVGIVLWVKREDIPEHMR
jgi:hypothetical protein